MREFKFRAWDPEQNLMTNTSPTHEEEYPFWLYGVLYSQESPLMQWTGFVDSEGVDIYEGDMVIDRREIPMEVRWWSHQGVWGVNPEKKHMWSEWLHEQKGLKVVGNIYENPELLENTQST